MRTLLGLLVALLVTACGSDDDSPPPDAGVDMSAPDVEDAALDALVDTGRDGPSADVARDTAEADADAADMGPVELDCLGEPLPLTLVRDLPYATIAVGAGTDASSGAFLLDLATTASAIDMSAFTTPPTAMDCDPSSLGQRCRFDDLDFFGSWGRVTLITQDFRGFGGEGVVQAGILGTDFFSLLTLTFDYARSEVRSAPRGSLCDDDVLLSAGFAALSSDGFYSNDPSSLRALRSVDEDGPEGVTVANVPTVPIRIAGVEGFAQLDTGFDDSLVPNAVNINTAYFDAIVAADPDALVRDAANDLALSTCVVGVTENVTAWMLSGPMQWIGEPEGGGAGGESVRESDGVRVFVKNTPPAAERCGGIGTWSVPAAQIAARLHADLGQFIVDPYEARVWIRAD